MVAPLSAAAFFQACGMAAPAAALQVIQQHALNPALVHEEFNEANFITIPAGGAFTRVVAVTCPQGQLGILDAFVMAVGNFADWDALVFQIRMSQAGVIALDDIRGPMSDLVRYRPTFVPMLASQTLEIVVRNTIALPINFVTGGLVGRFFPDDLPVEAARLAAAQGA